MSSITETTAERPRGRASGRSTARLSSFRPLFFALAQTVTVLVFSSGCALIMGPTAREATADVIERTPERLARGTYLMENVVQCMHCHSEHDMERVGMPVLPGKAFAGGFVLDEQIGFPGKIQPSNITPDMATGIGSYTDGELIRAIREGIKKDGTAIMPMMPYTAYRDLDDEDVKALVVYLRSLDPVVRETIPADLDFPINLFIKMAPAPVEGPVRAPSRDDEVAYGAYLVKMASCKDCHTVGEKGQLDETKAFAGGREFPIPTARGTFRSVTANITTSKTGYFGSATKDAWIARVRSYGALKENAPEAPPGVVSMMPWIEFSGLSDEDLSAIYAFMKTVAPVEQVVNTFPDATAASATTN